MNTRWNLLLAAFAVLGLAFTLSPPRSLGADEGLQAPASAGDQKKKKPRIAAEECECVLLAEPLDIEIPEFDIEIPETEFPEFDFEFEMPAFELPDVELLTEQVQGELAALEDQLLSAEEQQRVSDELRAHLQERKEEIERHAREMAEHARQMAEQARQHATAIFIEDSESGWLGISISEVTAEKAKELKLPAERGVLVGDVEADSAAAKAGVKEGDVITEFNGQRVEGTVQFRRMVRETPAGRTVQLTVWRDGRAQQLSAELASRQARIRERIVTMPRMEAMPRIEVFASRTPTLGISGENLEGQLGEYFGAPEGEGVLVKEVHEGTPAEKAGLKAGDVITKIDGERIKTVSELRAKLREKREAKSVKVEVVRKGATVSLDVEVEQPKPPAERRRISARRTSA